MASVAGLYLDFEISAGDVEAAERRLEAACSASAVASVLLRFGGAEFNRKSAGQLIAIAQNKGAAAIIDATAKSATGLNADGVHLSWSKDIVRVFKETRRDAPVGAIIGADAGRTRHDAMELGEAGANYVAFGVPAHVEDRAKAFERQVELISWWSQLFEIPCVAFDVPDIGQARKVTAAGADFVTVPIGSNMSANDAASRVREFADAVRANVSEQA